MLGIIFSGIIPFVSRRMDTWCHTVTLLHSWQNAIAGTTIDVKDLLKDEKPRARKQTRSLTVWGKMNLHK